jgi:hypothetical protein
MSKGNKKMKKSALLTVTALALAGILAAGSAMAATQSVTANIRFDTPLSLTKNSDINFGSVTASSATTYRISTAGAVSTVTGTGSYLFGTTAAANINITGSTTQLMNISVGGEVANNGVTVSNEKCAYNGGASGSCTITGAAAPGAGKTLLIGADAAADGTQAAGTTAAPTFTVTVVYQ